MRKKQVLVETCWKTPDTLKSGDRELTVPRRTRWGGVS